MLLLFLACGDSTQTPPKDCDCGERVVVADSEDSTPRDSSSDSATLETGTTSEVEVFSFECTAYDMPISLSITPGEPPPRIAVWAQGKDSSISWHDLDEGDGKQPAWRLLTELPFNEEGQALLPCEMGWYLPRDGEVDEDGDGVIYDWVYPTFTVYVWR